MRPVAVHPAYTRHALTRTLNTTSAPAIQIAKLAGFSPIITTASPHNTTLLTSLGATHVLDRSLPASAILSKLPELAAGKPIELVYDAIAHADTQVLAYQAAAPGGAIVLVLPEVIPADLKKDGDGKRVSGVFGNVHRPDNRACGEELYARLSEWLEKGIIKVRRRPLIDIVRRDADTKGLILMFCTFNFCSRIKSRCSRTALRASRTDWRGSRRSRSAGRSSSHGRRRHLEHLPLQCTCENLGFIESESMFSSIETCTDTM